MAATTIDYTLIQSTIVGPPTSYQVQASIDVAANPGTSLFVYRYSDQLFDHVATVLDVVTYPTSANPAFPFYRQTNVLKTFVAADEAIDFSASVKSRLTSLAKEYDIVAANFAIGTFPITVP